MGEAGEPVVVQAFVPETPVEAFDVGVLGWLPRRNGFESHTMSTSPLIERPAGEFRPLVGSDGLGFAAKAGGLIQDVGDIQSRSAEIGDAIDGFLGEVIYVRQDTDGPPGFQCIADEIHRPDLIGGCWQFQRFELDGDAGPFAAAFDRKQPAKSG